MSIPAQTLRVIGCGRVSTDAALLAASAVNGKVPRTGLVVAVDECFLHCGKALVRARLWDPGARIERRSFPTLARMIADQIAGVEEREAEAAVDHAYRHTLY